MEHGTATFLVGAGAGVTFQLRTIADIPTMRATEAELRKMTNMVQDDIATTFDNEGKIGRHEKWMALSPKYAAWKKTQKKGGGSQRILQLKGDLVEAASTGNMKLIREGKRMTVGYQMGSGIGKVAHYALFQYFGSNRVGGRSTGLSSTKIRKKKRMHFTGSPLKFQEEDRQGKVPGRPFIRLDTPTEEVLGITIRNLWAEQNVNVYLKKVFGV